MRPGALEDCEGRKLRDDWRLLAYKRGEAIDREAKKQQR
jgi:hypothetical protein